MNKQIQSYQIFEKIGTGGMGFVYKAKHLFREEIVAIKSLFPHLVENQDIRNRFISEAKILSTLKHPNIVKVLDFIEEADGLHLVMEYVEGRTLNKMIGKETGPIPAIRTLPIFEQILKAVEYAHSKGVIHRDIKPSNIMITKENVVKVMDFGIAHIEGSEMTRTGTKLGTLYYMSPEAIRGERTDERTDVYSLGVTLYEMLAGKLQYKETGEQLSEFMLMQKIMTEELKDPREYYPYIPDWLVEVVKKATEKNPDKRIQSIKNFINIIKKNTGELSKVVVSEISSRKSSDVIVSSERPDDHLNEIKNDSTQKTKKKKFSILLIILTIILMLIILSQENASDSLHSFFKSLFYKNIDAEVLTNNEPFTYYDKQNETIEPIKDTLDFRIEKKLEGHNNLVRKVLFSKDGSLLFSCSWDKTIKIWDVETGELLSTLEGHTGSITSILIIEEKSLIISGGWDKSIKIWNFMEGILLDTLPITSEQITSLALTSDNKFLAVGSWDGKIYLWNLDNKELTYILEAHTEGITSLFISKDDKFLISSSLDDTIILTDLSDGEVIQTFIGHNQDVLTVCLSNDNKLLFSGSWDNTIKIWDVETGSLINTLIGHSAGVRTLELDSENEIIISGSFDTTIKFWSIKTGELLKTLGNNDGEIMTIALNKDGKLASSGSEKFINIWKNYYNEP